MPTLRPAPFGVGPPRPAGPSPGNAFGQCLGVVRACAADFALCCTFATSCVPCGWHDCNNAPDDRCDSAPLDTGACDDPQLRPDPDATFCFD